MKKIPVNALPANAHELKVMPLGDFTPYDFARPHRHEYFEFFIFDSGGGSHFIDFIEYPIQDQSVHIVFPQQIHLVKRTAQAKGHVMICSRHFMNLLGKIYYTQLLNHNYTAPTLGFDSAAFTELRHTSLKLEQELLHQDSLLSSQLAQNYLSIFLSECIRRTAAGKNDEVAHSSYSQHDWAMYKRFSELMDEHFLDKQSVAFYAATLAVSPKVLNNCIKKVVNKTCVELIQERSLLEAKRLLLYTDESIKEIAFALNFKDSSYFTRFFTLKENKTPKAFKAYWEEKYHS